jgi:hypothetical protein
VVKVLDTLKDQTRPLVNEDDEAPEKILELLQGSNSTLLDFLKADEDQKARNSAGVDAGNERRIRACSFIYLLLWGRLLIFLTTFIQMEFTFFLILL